jgi:methionyl-tRNA synthetase
MTKPFYITTAIHYTNAKPHIGHAYENIAADAVARWHRKCGKRVFFLTGTDENGQKVEKSAREAGMAPKEFVDSIVPHFKNMNSLFNISNDNFIRTTDPKHRETARKIFKKVMDKGDIYLGEYEGLYCSGCEKFLLERDLVNGKCPTHERPPDMLKEKSFFFKMGAYRDRLIEHFRANPRFVMPETRYNEVFSRLEEELRDLSVSRTSFSWGIPVPEAEDHVIYVWFDALLNYISGAPEECWPADIHLIGKDISWFHAVIWPCILMAAGYELPKTVFCHGWILVRKEGDAEAKKISKSLGNVVDPVELASAYGPDPVRFFLLRDNAFGQDGEFSFSALHGRINGDLANELGNLVSRTSTMVHKFSGGRVPKRSDSANPVREEASTLLKRVSEHFEEVRLNMALDETWKLIRTMNKFVDTEKPWELAKKGDTERLESVLYSLLEGIRISAHFLEPFIPATAPKILEFTGAEDGGFPLEKLSDWGRLKEGAPVLKMAPLFPKVEA